MTKRSREPSIEKSFLQALDETATRTQNDTIDLILDMAKKYGPDLAIKALRDTRAKQRRKRRA
jgi:predicted RNA-binding protein with RPS1 domain